MIFFRPFFFLLVDSFFGSVVLLSAGLALGSAVVPFAGAAFASVPAPAAGEFAESLFAAAGGFSVLTGVVPEASPFAFASPEAGGLPRGSSGPSRRPPAGAPGAGG